MLFNFNRVETSLRLVSRSSRWSPIMGILSTVRRKWPVVVRATFGKSEGGQSVNMGLDELRLVRQAVRQTGGSGITSHAELRKSLERSRILSA